MAGTIVRTWNTHAIKTLIHNGAKEGTEKCARHLLDVSQNLVPYDTGELQRSGKVDPTDSGYIVSYHAHVKRKTRFMKNMDRKTRNAAIALGTNPDEFDYSIIQHEEEDFAHDDGRQAKYLENPAKQYKEMYKQWIAESVGDKL